MSGRHRTAATLLAVLAIAIAAAPALAQGIRVEIRDGTDGDATICAAPGDSLEAELWVWPGSDETECLRTCFGTPRSLAGGSTHLATGAISLAFDAGLLDLVSTTTNPDTAARDALMRIDRAAEGRVGWALAGDWTVDGDPTSRLVDPCDMALLDEAGWVLRLGFAAGPPGQGVLHLRTTRDDPPFALSFADLCTAEAFTLSNGGIGAAADAAVLVSTDCDGVIFFDAFETGDTSRW